MGWKDAAGDSDKRFCLFVLLLFVCCFLDGNVSFLREALYFFQDSKVCLSILGRWIGKRCSVQIVDGTDMSPLLG